MFAIFANASSRSSLSSCWRCVQTERSSELQSARRADMGEEHASIVRRRYLSIFVGIVLLQALDRPVLGNPDVTILAASLGPLLVPLFWFSCPARRHNTSLAKMIKTPKCDGLHLSLSGWPCIGLCHSRVAGRRRHSGGCPILLFHGREVSEFHTHIYKSNFDSTISFLRHPCPARI